MAVQQKGMKFIATNPDKYTMQAGIRIPGNGSFMRLVEEATSIKAEIAGKPNTFIIDFLI